MLFKALVLILPTLAVAQIHVRVNAASTMKSAFVEYDGLIEDIFTETDRKTFNLTDAFLIEAITHQFIKYEGYRPKEVYIRKPSRLITDDTHRPIPEIKKRLVPIKATILSLDGEPMAVANKRFINNSSYQVSYTADVTQTVEERVTSMWSKRNELSVDQSISYKFFKATILSLDGEPMAVANKRFINNSSYQVSYTADVTQTVEETVTSMWSKRNELSVDQSISYKFFCLGGETRFSYMRTWGKDSTTSKSVTIGTSSAVTVTLGPRQSAVATLTAFRSVMDIEVEYNATLSGYVFVSARGGFDKLSNPSKLLLLATPNMPYVFADINNVMC